MDSKDCYEVVKKLIGSVEPVGATNTDKVRFENLSKHIDLTDALLDDLFKVANNFNRPEYSMSRAGKEAQKYLKTLSGDLLEFLVNQEKEKR